MKMRGKRAMVLLAVCITVLAVLWIAGTEGPGVPVNGMRLRYRVTDTSGVSDFIDVSCDQVAYDTAKIKVNNDSYWVYLPTRKRIDGRGYVEFWISPKDVEKGAIIPLGGLLGQVVGTADIKTTGLILDCWLVRATDEASVYHYYFEERTGLLVTEYIVRQASTSMMVLQASNVAWPPSLVLKSWMLLKPWEVLLTASFSSAIIGFAYHGSWKPFLTASKIPAQELLTAGVSDLEELPFPVLAILLPYLVALLVRVPIVIGSQYKYPMFDPYTIVLGYIPQTLYEFTQHLILTPPLETGPGLSISYGLLSMVFYGALPVSHQGVPTTLIPTYPLALWGPIFVYSSVTVSTYFLGLSVTRNRKAAFYCSLLSAVLDFVALRTSYITADGFSLAIYPLVMASMFKLEMEFYNLRRIAFFLLLMTTSVFIHPPSGAVVLSVAMLCLLLSVKKNRHRAERLLLLFSLLGTIALVLALGDVQFLSGYFFGQLNAFPVILLNFFKNPPSLDTFYGFTLASLYYPNKGFLVLFAGSVISLLLSVPAIIVEFKARRPLLVAMTLLLGATLFISVTFEAMYGGGGFGKLPEGWIYSDRLASRAAVPLIVLSSMTLVFVERRFRKGKILVLSVVAAMFLCSTTFLFLMGSMVHVPQNSGVIQVLDIEALIVPLWAGLSIMFSSIELLNAGGAPAGHRQIIKRILTALAESTLVANGFHLINDLGQILAGSSFSFYFPLAVRSWLAVLASLFLLVTTKYHFKR